MKIKQMIDDYVKSHFQLSLGTGSAIAAIAASTDTIYIDVKGEALDVKKYRGNIDSLVINVETLTRNIIQAIPTTIREKAINSYQEYLLELVVREMHYIDNLLEGKFKKGVYFLFPDYEKVYMAYYMPKRKHLPTKKEAAEKAIEDIAFSISKKAGKLDINFIIDDYKIGLRGDVLLLTHYGHDLMNYKKNKNLKLIESHTGRVIDYTGFNKKYRNSTKADASRLPWDEVLMMVLGTETIKSPIRGAMALVLEAAEKNKWTPNTTRDKIVANLSRIDELKDFTKFKGLY